MPRRRIIPGARQAGNAAHAKRRRISPAPLPCGTTALFVRSAAGEQIPRDGSEEPGHAVGEPVTKAGTVEIPVVGELEVHHVVVAVQRELGFTLPRRPDEPPRPRLPGRRPLFRLLEALPLTIGKPIFPA
jgi:hypothetical protein